MRVAQGGFARLAEEDDAEELDHDVGGERRREREQRRAERQQHVDERLAAPRGANRNACSSSHSDTKPLSGGRPAMASAPTSVSHATQGMRWMRPPSRPRLRSPVACSTEPVPRNSRLFMNA